MPYQKRSKGTGKKNIISEIASGSATSYEVFTSGSAKRIAKVDARTKFPIKIDTAVNALDLAYNTTNFYLNPSNQLSLTITGTATDLNYYTTGAALVGTNLVGQLAGTTATWTANLAALSDATFWSSGASGVYSHQTGTSVGVGTVAPLAKFHVSGAEAIPQFKITSGGANLFYVSGGIVSGTAFYGDASNLRNIPGALWISSSGKLYPKGIGNQVGIGTIPDADTPLHVSGAGTSIMWNNETNQPALHLLNSSSNGEVLRLTSRADGRTMYFQTDHIYMNGGAFHIGNDNTNIYLRSAGKKVGVGTSNPKEFFHVAGASLLSGNTVVGGNLDVSGNSRLIGTMVLASGATVHDIQNTVTGSQFALANTNAIVNYVTTVTGSLLPGVSGTKYSQAYRWVIASSSAITSALGSGAAYSSAYKWVNASGAIISSWYAASASKFSENYDWFTTSSSAITTALGSGSNYSAATRWYVASASTLSLDNKWRVASGSNYSAAYRWYNASASALSTSYRWVNASGAIISSWYAASSSLYSEAYRWVNAQSGTLVNYWGSGTNAIYPDATGTKVGIGTLNPKYMLHVSGSRTAANDAKVMIQSREPQIYISSSRSDTLWNIGANNNDGVLYFKRNDDLVGKIDSTNAWVFGYPGVPSMPGTKVDVRGNALISGSLYFNSGAAGINKVSIYNNNRMDFSIAGQPRLHLDSSTLKSNVSAGPSMDLTPGPPGTANYGFVDDTDTGMSRTAANTLGLLTAGVTGMTMDSSQKVGIGVAAPSEHFHVQSDSNTQALFKSTDNRGIIQVADDDTTVSLVAEGTKASLGTVAGLSAANLTINNTGRVGVGTVNPGFALHVSQSAGQAYGLIVSGTAAARGVYIGDTTGDATGYGKIGGFGGSLFIGPSQIYTSFIPTADGDVKLGEVNRRWSRFYAISGAFGYSNGNSELERYVLAVSGSHSKHPLRVRASGTANALIVTSGGRVGIKATPAQVLSNGSQLNVGGHISVSSSTPANAIYKSNGYNALYHDNSTAWVYGGPTNLQFVDYTSGDTSMAIASKKVGIGTITPEAPFHVASTSDLPIAIYSGSGDTSYHYKTTGSGDISFQYQVQQGRSADMALINHTTPTEMTTIRQKVVDANNSSILFRTRDGGALVSPLIISSSNIGINRVSPNAKLHVGAAHILVSGAASYIDVGRDGGYQSTIRAESDTPLEIRGDTGFGANIKYVRNNGSYGFFAGMLDNASRFDIAANGGDSEIIASFTSDQKVGIGTTKPIGPLTVSQSTLLEGFSLVGSGQKLRSFFNTNGMGIISGSKDVQVKAAGDSLYLAGAEHLYLDNGTRNTYSTIFRDGTGEYARFKNANLGIGTNAPAKKLDVRGDNSTWALAALSGSSEYGTGLQLYNSHSTIQDWAILGGGASKNYTFRIYDQTDAKYRFAIDRDGKVGIGGSNDVVINPTEILDVRGNAFLSGSLSLISGSTIDDVSTSLSATSRARSLATAASIFSKINTTSGALNTKISAVGGGSPGGSNTQIQYNNGGSFGGISIFTFDGTDVSIDTTAGAKLLFGAAGEYIQGSGSDIRIHASDNVLIAPADDLNIRADDVTIETTSAAEYVRFDGGNKRVGIGTNNPGDYLTVNSSADDDPAIKLANSRSGTSGSLRLENRGSSVQFITTGTAEVPYRFTLGSNEVMRIGTGGVAIYNSGTMSDAVADLDVQANTNASGAIGNAWISPVFANYAGFSHYAKRTSTGGYALLASDDGTTYVNAALGKKVYLRENNSTKFMLDGNHFRSDQTNGASMRNEVPSSTNPVFTFNNDVDTGIGRAADHQLSLIASGQNIMNISSIGQNKRVGILTTDPQEALDVDGNLVVRDSHTLAAGDSSDVFLYHDGNSTIRSNTGVMNIVQNAASLMAITSKHAIDITIDDDSGSPSEKLAFKFGSAGNTRMTFANTGMGIGIASPAASLDVRSDSGLIVSGSKTNYSIIKAVNSSDEPLLHLETGRVGFGPKIRMVASETTNDMGGIAFQAGPKATYWTTYGMMGANVTSSGSDGKLLFQTLQGGTLSSSLELAGRNVKIHETGMVLNAGNTTVLEMREYSSNRGQICFYPAGGTSKNRIYASTEASANMVMHADAKILLDPDETLDIQSTGVLFKDTGGNTHLTVAETGTNGSLLTSAGILRIDSGDDINLDANTGLINIQYAGTEAIRFNAAASNPNIIQSKRDGYDIDFRDYDNLSSLYLKQGQKVGIGNGVPVARLHVSSAKPLNNGQPTDSFMVSGTHGFMMYPFAGDAGSVNLSISGNNKHTGFLMATDSATKDTYMQMGNDATEDNIQWAFSGPIGSSSTVIQMNDYHGTHQFFYASGGNFTNFGKKGGRAGIFATPHNKGGAFNGITGHKNMMGLAVGSGAASATWNLGLGKGLWLHDNANDITEFWKNNKGTKMLALGSGSYDVIVPGTLNVIGNLYQNGSQITPGGGGGGGAPTDASYITLGTDGDLSAERVLTAGSGIGFTDGGAGSTLTVAANAAQTGITSIYNTSLKVGRDSTDLIDFDTNNEITIRANNADQIKITDGTIEPITNNDVGLGTASKAYSIAHLADGAAYHVGASGGITEDIPYVANINVVTDPAGAILAIDVTNATLQVKGGVIVRNVT